MKFVSSDGRAFTDYRPNCAVNEALQKASGSTNTHAYRKYLQDNGLAIMNKAKTTLPYKKCEFCPKCKKAIQ